MSNENKLLTTIKSRCTKIYFESLSNEKIENYIVQRQKEKVLNKNMLELCNGSIGKAITIQEKIEEYEQVEKIILNIDKNDIIEIYCARKRVDVNEIENHFIYNDNNINTNSFNISIIRNNNI